VLASGFRWPFTFALPSGTSFAFGPDHGPTYLEVRFPAAAETGTPAGVIVQAIGSGRTNPCAADSLPLPIAAGPGSVIEYLRTVPGLILGEDAPARVELNRGDYISSLLV
jgi:hypothetical protein